MQIVKYTQQVISVNGTHGSAEQVPPLNLLSSHWSDSVCERKENNGYSKAKRQ